MDKYQEGLNYLKGYAEKSQDRFAGEACDYLQELVDKNTPMKPIYGGKFPACPKCGKLCHSIWQNHCDECGQVLDWSEEE